jgi:hypothetical protein
VDRLGEQSQTEEQTRAGPGHGLVVDRADRALPDGGHDAPSRPRGDLLLGHAERCIGQQDELRVLLDQALHGDVELVGRAGRDRVTAGQHDHLRQE